MNVRGSGTPSLPAATVAAWQSAFAAEQVAVLGYETLGPRLASDADASLARACQDAHEQRRDATAVALAAAGHRPDEPSVLHAPAPLASVDAARRLAIRLEDDAAAAWRYLYARAASGASTSTSEALRTAAQAGLTDCAARALRWRVLVSPAHATRPFPGVA